MRKWLRRLGIAVVLMAVASATALYSYGRFAEAARGPASHALPTAADATALDRAVAPLLRAHPGRSGMALLADNLDVPPAHAPRGAAWTCSTTSGTTTSPATCWATRCCARPTAVCACACCWTT